MEYTADQLIKQLGMAPHKEGGWYRFSWHSDLTIGRENLPEGYSGDRYACGLIYYLLKHKQVSGWHQIMSPEIWTWHSGASLIMTLGGDGEEPISGEEIRIGSNLEAGDQFQVVVPANQWQTTRLESGGYALVSCIVSPAFHEDDCYLPNPLF